MSRKLMLYAGYSPSGSLTPLQKEVLVSTAKYFYALDVETIAIYATDQNPEVNLSDLFPKNIKVLTRKNEGYDFGSWSYGLSTVNLSDYTHIIFMNDSIIGPFYDIFPLVNTIVNDDNDYLGITESEQIASHFQSYCFTLSTRALRINEVSHIFQIDKIPKNQNSERGLAISKKEVPLLSIIQKSGLTARAVWKAGTLTNVVKNPSLDGWERLFGSGFAFVKRTIICHENNRTRLLDIISTNNRLPNLDIIDAL